MNPAVAGIFMYTQIIYCYSVDIVAFDAKFSGLQLLGGAIILVFCLASAIQKKKETEEKKLKESEEDKQKVVVVDQEQENDYKRV